MYRTVQLSSCVSAQGELVEVLGNGEVLVRDGGKFYRGQPVALHVVPPAAAVHFIAGAREQGQEGT